MRTVNALAVALTVAAALAPMVASADHRGHDRGRHLGWRRDSCRSYARYDYDDDPYVYRRVVYRPRYVYCPPVYYRERPGVTLVIRF